MGSPLSELVVSIVGDVSGIQGAFDEVGQSAASIGSSLNKLGGDMAAMGSKMTMGVTVPLLALGAAAVASFSQLDNAYDYIRVGTGATGEALEGLITTYKDILRDVPASTADVGIAVADLSTRLGLTGEPLETLATQFLELSRITGTDVTTNIETVTRVFGDWGISAEQQGTKLDYLYKVSQATGIGVDQLSQLMVQYGAPLRQLGFDYDTSAALIGKFNKEGVNTELVMGSMRIALGKMAQEGVTDANEALTIIIERIQTAGSVGEANAISMEYFGARAGPDMAAAIREGRFEIGSLVADLQSSSETIIKTGDDTADFGEKIQIMKNKILLAMEPLGTAMVGVFDSLQPAIEGAIGCLAEISVAFSNLGPTTQLVIVALGGIAVAIGPVLVAGGVLISSIGSISIALGAAGGLSGVLATVVGILTGPVAIAIAAFAAAAYIVYKNWDTVGPLVKETFDIILAAIKPVADSIMAFVTGALASLSAWWATNGPAISQAATTIFNVIGPVFTTLSTVILGFVYGALVVLWESFTVAVNIIIPIVQYLGAQVGDVIMLVVNAINGDWSAAWQNAQNIVQRSWDFIVSIFNGQLLYNAVKGVWDNVLLIISQTLDLIIGIITGKTGEAATGLKNGMVKAGADMITGTLGWIPGVSGVVDGIVNKLTEVPTGASQAMTAFGPAIINPIDATAIQASAHAGTLVTSTVNQIGNMPGLATGALSPLSASITSPIDSASVQAAAHAGTLVTGTVNQISFISPRSASAMSGFTPAIVNPINAAISPASSAAGRVGAGATTSLNNGMSPMAGNVRTTMNGVASAMSSSGSVLASAATSAGQRAVDAINAQLAKARAALANVKSAFDSATYYAGNMPSSGHGGSSSSSGSSGIQHQGDDGTGESGVSIREAHATGGLAGYTGWHWMEEKELAVPEQFDWDGVLTASLTKAVQSVASSKGSNVSNSYGGDTTVNIYATMTPEYDFDKLMDDVDKRLSMNASRTRFRKGITT